MSLDPPSAPASPPDRWRVATWSLLFPGVGQFVLGRAVPGTALLTVAVLGGAAFTLSLLADGFPMAAGWIGLALAAGCELAGIVLAYRDAEPAADRGPASAWKAVFWSRLMPGLGQMIEGRRAAALGFFATVAIAALLGLGAVGIAATVLVWGAGPLEAWLRSKASRTHALEAPRVLAALVGLTIVGVVLPPVTRATVLRAARIPSGSMAPTLQPGDYFLIDVTRRGHAAPGDLLVYRDPADPQHEFCKRCIAVGGQTVELRDKRLWVDGRPVEEPYAFHADAAVRPGAEDPRDNLGPYAVPAGHVFVMGDNRDNSNDSRYSGPIPLTHVAGRATKVYWPPPRLGRLPRAGD